MRFSLPRIFVATLLVSPLLAACGSSNPGTSAGAITVDAKDDSCVLSATTAHAGKVEFSITNNGSQVNEFYVYAADGKQIVGELENLGPGLSRDLTVNLGAGDYITACRPNGVGEGMRAAFKVTGTAVSPAVDSTAATTAQEEYADWVRARSASLLERTRAFTHAYATGDQALARRLYPRARMPWEAIETVAESFSDLDAKTDAREADLGPGQAWTGWHRIEKDLWPPVDAAYTKATPAERKALAQALLTNVEEVHSRIQDMTWTLDAIANGASALMEEVATGKVTGEEEHWSHTDLYDFAANVEGARRAFEFVRPILADKNPELEEELSTRFTALEKQLSAHRHGTGFVGYDTLSQAQVKALADSVNAVSEPLSELTSAVLS